MEFVCLMYKVNYGSLKVLNNCRMLQWQKHSTIWLCQGHQMIWGQHLSHGIVSKTPYFLEKGTMLMFQTWLHMEVSPVFSRKKKTDLKLFHSCKAICICEEAVDSFAALWQTPSWTQNQSSPKFLSVILSRSLEAPLGMPEKEMANWLAVNQWTKLMVG